MNMFLALRVRHPAAPPESLLRERKSRSGTRSRACRKKTDMPRYKFHANVEASIPSAPGTQLMMSHMLSPTTKQCPIMSATGSIARSVRRF